MKILGRNNRGLLLVAGLAGVFGLFLAGPTWAQAPDLGLGFATATGLATTDVRTLVGTIIKGFIGLLGLVAVVLLIYAGFLWMTAKGEEEQITKSKRIMVNAAIGLVIIMASYAIVSFIFRAILGGSGVGGDGECPVGQNCSPPSCIGSCDVGSIFRVQGVAPVGSGPNANGWPKNYGFTMQFSAALVESTVNVNTLIVRRCGPMTAAFNINDCSPGTQANVVAGTRVVQGASVTFKPSGTAGEFPTDFVPGFWYLVRAVGNEIRDAQNRALTCPFASGSSADPASTSARSDLCDRAATFGDFRDTQAPTASIVQPLAGSRFCPATRMATQVEGRDDFMVAQLEYKLTDSTGASLARLVSPTGVLLPAPVRAINSQAVNPFATGEVALDVVGLTPGDYGFSVTPQDGIPTVGAATTSNFIINPPHCCNGVQNGNATTSPFETGIDCGINSGCGACAGDVCTTNGACKSGACVEGQCVELPVIESITPTAAGPGSLITIRGKYFGTSPGSVIFLGGAGETDDKPSAACSDRAWRQNADGSSIAVVPVPVGAVDGPIKLVVAGGSKSDSTDVAPGWSGSFDVNTTVTPGICYLEPNTGRSGNEFAINGSGFGAANPDSKVKFGALDASLASGTSWAAEKISALVPPTTEGLHDVKVSVLNLATTGDLTDRLESNPVPYSIAPAADQSRPIISEVIPTSGPAGTFVTLRGSGFGSTPGRVRLLSGTKEANALPPAACGQTWTPNYVVIKVPEKYATPDATENLGLGGHNFIITKYNSNDSSNPAAFTVNNSPLRPGLCSITPDNGPAGTGVIIKGEGFGVTAAPGPTSAPRFSVEFFKETGGICLSGGPCTVLGDVCGGTSVCVPKAFASAVSQYPSGEWKNNQILTAVAGDRGNSATWARTGPVYVIANNQLSSNAVPFKVGNCNEAGNACSSGICCADGACRASCPRPPVSTYGWKFSTEVLPTLPLVVERQSCGAAAQQSPSPFKDSTDACKNASFRFEFSKPMELTATTTSGFITTPIANATIKVEPCGDGAAPAATCAAAIALGSPNATNSGNSSAVTVAATSTLQKNTWYRVTLISDPAGRKGIISDDGIYLDGDVDDNEGGNYIYHFKTQNTDTACALDHVAVWPQQYSVDHQGAPGSAPGTTPGFLAGLYAANCNPLNCRVAATPYYNIGWSSVDNGSGANQILTPASSAVSACNEYFAVTASRETIAGNPVVLTAAATDIAAPGLQAKSGSAKVTVRFTDPTVVEHAPACTEACVNAEVFGRFNVAMDPNSFAGNAELLKCRNASCLPPYETVTGIAVRSATATSGGVTLANGKVIIDHPAFSPSSYYFVRLRGGASGIKSASGVPLKGLNDGNYFAWTFRTKDSAVPCAVRRVTNSPLNLVLRYIGERAQIDALPFGAPDSCNANGQALQSSSYNWQWIKTASGVVDGFVVPTGAGPRLSATGDVDTVVEGAIGCTDSCLNVGTRGQTTQCGNRVLDKGEDCDDGNTANNDGCSNQCLHEGSTAGTDMIFAEGPNRLNQPEDFPTVTPYGGATVVQSGDAVKGELSARVQSTGIANADGNYGGVRIRINNGAIAPGRYLTLSFLAKKIGGGQAGLHASIQNSPTSQGVLAFDTGNLNTTWTRYSFDRQVLDSKDDIVIWSNDANAVWLVDEVAITDMTWFFSYGQVVTAVVGRQTCGNSLIEPGETCEKIGSIRGIFPPGCKEPTAAVPGCVFTGSVNASCVAPTQTLVAAWSGNNTPDDVSAGTNNLTLQNNLSYGAGKFGGALRFDGVDDFADVSETANLSGASGVVVKWGTPAAPNNGTFGDFSPNGPYPSNVKVPGTSPFNNPTVLWESANTLPYRCWYVIENGNNVQKCADGPSGGWHYAGIPVDTNKEYRSSVWIKRTVSTDSGHIYLGLDGENTNHLDGTLNRNPYNVVIEAKNLELGEWYLFVGYVHAKNDSSNIHKSAVYRKDGSKLADYDGVYDRSGAKIPGKVVHAADYKHSGATSVQVHRTFNYYDQDRDTIQYFWGPRFDEVTASTPPNAADLLAGEAANIAPVAQGLIGLSIEGWVKYDGAANADGAIISKFKHSNGTDADDSYYFGIAPGSGEDKKLRWQVNTAGGATASKILAVNVPAALRDGAFHHLAATYDGSRMRMYFDGEELGTGLAASGAVNSSTTPLRLGATAVATTVGQPAVADAWFFKGIIDELKVYNRGLTSDDIDTIYRAALGQDCARGKAGRCGDNAVGDGESCDDGNVANGDGCNSQCLNEGAPAQGTAGAGYCGDGVTDPGEDRGCEKDTSTCIGTAASCPAANGCVITSCLKIASTFKGSSIFYTQPSVCRDGIVGTGEVARCEELPDGTRFSGDGKKDGTQYVQAGSPGTAAGQTRTDTVTTTVAVSAAQPAVPTADQGKTTVSMSCTCRDAGVAAPQAFCDALTPGTPNDLGCATSGCCIMAPIVTGPAFPTGGNICRNTAVRTVFDVPMDAASVGQKMTLVEEVAAANCGFVCANDLATRCATATAATDCPGSTCVARERIALSTSVSDTLALERPPLISRIWNKVVSFFHRVFNVLGANAAPTPGTVWCKVPGNVSMNGQVASFTITKALAANKRHVVIIDGGEDGAAATSGATLKSDYTFDFTTGADICVMDSVSVSPRSYLFGASEDAPAILNGHCSVTMATACSDDSNCPATEVCLGDENPADKNDGDEVFEARALSRGGAAQIVSTPEYGFKWNWTEPPATEPIQIGPPNHITAPPEINNGFCEEGEPGGAAAADCGIDLASAAQPKPAAGIGNNVCERGESAAGNEQDCAVAPGESNVVTVRVRNTVKGAATQGQTLLRVAAETTERGVIKSNLEGTADVTVMLCKNPWPKRRTCNAAGDVETPIGWPVGSEPYPWDAPPTASAMNSRTGVADICLAGNPGLIWYPFYDPSTNISFYYCRDGQEQGDGEALLPEIDEQRIVRIQPGRDIFREYLMPFSKDVVVGGQTATWTKDAIGLRISQNSEHVSPATWYRQHNFAGTPSATTVAGYSGLQEGRTVYVNAGALTAADGLYTNMNVYSYNDGAAPQTVSVFNQLLVNSDFNRNIKETRVCYDGTAANAQAEDAAGAPIGCRSDLDCRVDTARKPLVGRETWYCDANKSKLVRDVKRWEDLQGARASLLGRTSYPTVEAGSYLRGSSVSTWPSWSGTLRQESGVALPRDPINAFGNCAAAKPAGVLGWWSGEGSGANRAGSGEGVQLGGVTYTAGKFGQAFAFSGESGAVRVVRSTAIEPATAITVEAWVKAAVQTGSNKFIVSKSYSGHPGDTGSYGFSTGSGGLTFRMSILGVGDVGTAEVPANQIWDGKLHHIAGTYDSSLGTNQLKLYVDGALKGNGAATGNIAYDATFQNGDLLIGNSDLRTDAHAFNGLVDEVALYGVALTDNQIKALAIGAYDQSTCWDADNRLYQCPVGSHVYEYQARGGEDFNIKAGFESVDCEQFKAQLSCEGQQRMCRWYDNGTSGNPNDDYCVRNVNWRGTTCMERPVNGVPCDKGECSLDKAVRCDADADCTGKGICSKSCEDTSGVCRNKLGKLEIHGLPSVAPVCRGSQQGATGACGDGVKQTLPGQCVNFQCSNGMGACTVDGNCLEECEPGESNISPCRSYTGKTCGGDSDCTAYGGGACSGGVCVNSRTACTADSATYGLCRAGAQKQTCLTSCKFSAPGACGAGRCGDGVVQNPESCDDGDALNGTYGHCRKDCSQLGPRCGDGAVQAPERCDDGANNGQYKTSSTGPLDWYCAWDCSGLGPRCGDGTVNGNESCDRDIQDFKGYCPSGVGCETDVDCGGAVGSCSHVCPTKEQHNQRSCPLSCQWLTGGNFGWSCTQPGQCPNGVVETGEQCDDNNTDNTDACVIFNVVPPPAPPGAAEAAAAGAAL